MYILAKISINLKTVFYKNILYINISNFCAKCKDIFKKILNHSISMDLEN